MKTIVIIALTTFTAVSNAFAARRTVSGSHKETPKVEYIKCVSSGGRIALVPALDCPYPGKSFDDFKTKFEQRVQSLRAGRF